MVIHTGNHRHKRKLSDRDRQAWIDATPQLQDMHTQSKLSKRDFLYYRRVQIDEYIHNALKPKSHHEYNPASPVLQPNSNQYHNYHRKAGRPRKRNVTPSVTSQLTQEG